MGFYMTINPIRIQFKTACELLDISRESLRHIVRTDATFPRPIKTGESKQSPVYFDYAELLEWHNTKKQSLSAMEAYTDDGDPMYSLEDIAKHFGISFEDAEQHLLKMMDNRQQVGLSNDGILKNSNIHINLVQ